jgi:hypothetical protein
MPLSKIDLLGRLMFLHNNLPWCDLSRSITFSYYLGTMLPNCSSFLQYNTNFYVSQYLVWCSKKSNNQIWVIVLFTDIRVCLCMVENSLLGVLGTQETFCIVIAGLLERDTLTSSSLSSINLG